MQDRSAGALRVLVVDDRLDDPRAWQVEADRVDPRIVVRCAATTAALQKAILEGDWACVLCNQAPRRLTVNAVLAMTQVLDPQPAVLLYPSADSASDRQRWMHAALRAQAPNDGPLDALADATADTPIDGARRLNQQFDLDLGAAPSPFDSPATSGRHDVGALRALRNSEERFRTLTEIAPVGIFLTDADQRCIYANERWSEITGIPAAEALGLDWRACLQTQGATLEATALFAADPMTPVTFENPVVQTGRPAAWVMGQMRPYRDARGDIVGHLGVITDITDRKTAEVAIQESEQRLRDLSTHMTSAEERQRAQIAREIHDDIGSSLTGMKIDVLRLKQLTADIPEAQDRLAAFTRLLDSSAASSVRIAKALRPSILDDGIVPAIDWQLREFAKRMNIDTEFVEPEREPQLTADQSIALFRVVQEALNNVAKHAQARHVDVVLFARTNELTLEIRDDGRGLPRDRAPERIERGGGFGITGMRERVLSLGGWMDVTGAPGKGTTVMVGIPMHGRPTKTMEVATA